MSEVGGDEGPPTIRGYKHRINQLFYRPDAERVDGAVRYVHSAMADASLLIKYRLLKAVRTTPRNVAPIEVSEETVLTAVRAVLNYRGASDDVGTCRKTSHEGAGDGTAERQATLKSWSSDYREMFSGTAGHVPLFDQTLSVSHMLGVAAKQYAAAAFPIFMFHVIVRIQQTHRGSTLPG